jgi:hypothetical protein
MVRRFLLLDENVAADESDCCTGACRIVGRVQQCGNFEG